MQQISVDGKDRSNDLLRHSESDEELVATMESVVTSPKPFISHLIATRSQQDKQELRRILNHLPMAQDISARRQLLVSKSTLASVGAQSLQQTPRGGNTPRTPVVRGAGIGPGFRTATSAASGGGAPSPRREKQHQGITFATPRRSAVPEMPTDVRNSVGPANSGKFVPFLGPPGLAADRSEMSSGMLQSAAPLENTVVQVEPAFDSEAELRAYEERRTRENAAAQVAADRVTRKLAEIGVDPKGMEAGEVLKILYARGAGSSYWFMNREVEQKTSEAERDKDPKDKRAPTPLSFRGLLTERASQEIRNARNVPMTNVHRCLDRWEIDFLADVCRSLKHFDSKTQGQVSEYQSRICGLQHGKTKRGS